MKLIATGLFDCVFSAHEHFSRLRQWRELEAEDGKTVLFHPGNCKGTAVTKLRLRATEGRVQVVGKETLVLDESFEADKGVLTSAEKLLAGFSAKIETIVEEVVGKVESDNYTKAFLKQNLTPHGITPLTNLILDSYFYLYQEYRKLGKSKVNIRESHVVGLINFGSIRKGLTKGELTIGQLMNCSPFNGGIEMVRMTGKHLEQVQKRNENRILNHVSKEIPGMVSFLFRMFLMISLL